MAIGIPSDFRRISIGLFFVFAVISATSARGVAQDASGPFARGEKEGLSAIAILTDNPDWLEEWNAPNGTVPQYSGSAQMHVGDRAWLILMFSGAAQGVDGVALDCSLRIVGPDGVEDLNMPTRPCYRGEHQEHPERLHLTGLQLEVTATADDAPGRLTIDLGIEDLSSGRVVPLRLSTELTGRRR